jgi:hypothetical protein
MNLGDLRAWIIDAEDFNLDENRVMMHIHAEIEADNVAIYKKMIYLFT